MFRGTGNRLTRVVKRERNKAGTGWIYLVWPGGRPSCYGRPCIDGPDGEVDEVPAGARTIVISWSDNWRGDNHKKPSWPTVSVAVELEADELMAQDIGASPVPVGDDAVPPPEPAPAPRPDAWVVGRPAAGDIASWSDSMSFWSAKDRVERANEFIEGLVSIAGPDVPSDQLYPTRALALAAATLKFEHMCAAYADDYGG